MLEANFQAQALYQSRTGRVCLYFKEDIRNFYEFLVSFFVAQKQERRGHWKEKTGKESTARKHCFRHFGVSR